MSYADLMKNNEFLDVKCHFDESMVIKKMKKPSVGRKVSKSYGKFPEIVIDPPKENITVSLPDITASTVEESLRLSCPNLNDVRLYDVFTSNLPTKKVNLSNSSLETSQESLSEKVDIPKELEVIENIDFAVTSCIDTLSCLAELKTLQKKCTVEKTYLKIPVNVVKTRSKFSFQNFYKNKRKALAKDVITSIQNVEFHPDLEEPVVKPKRKYNLNAFRRKKVADITPSDLLKQKMKQSVSLHNLHTNTKTVYAPSGFDNYHTIHSDCNLPRSFIPFNKEARKYGSGGFRGHCYGNQYHFDSFYPSNSNCNAFCGAWQHNSSRPLGYFDGNDCIGNYSESKEVAIYKCCCGRARCETVVPIQQYLETYFEKRVRRNPDIMLGVYTWVAMHLSLL